MDTGRWERGGYQEDGKRWSPGGGKEVDTGRWKEVGTGRRERGGHREEGKRWTPGGGKEVDTWRWKEVGTGKRKKGGQPEGGKRAGTRRREIGGTGRRERDGQREERWPPRAAKKGMEGTRCKHGTKPVATLPLFQNKERERGVWGGGGAFFSACLCLGL